MATADNVVHLAGNLAADPELRFTANGVAVVSLRVAINERRRNDRGEWEDADVHFIPVTAWRDLAEHAAESLTKGDRVAVLGRLRTRSYEDKEGVTRWVTEVVADEVSPSLRWANARPQKARRDTGPPHPADAPASSGRTWPDDDEVPF